MLLTFVLWWWQGGFSFDSLLSLLLTALVAYIVVETSNIYQILRVRSRMITSVWLMGMACIGDYHTFHPVLLSTFCLAISCYLLFRTYQHPQPVVDVFHTFLFIALGSMAFPPMLFLTPFFLWYLIVFMRSFTARTLFAAIVGLLAPFWFGTGWLLWQGNLSPLTTWWNDFCCMTSLFDWRDFNVSGMWSADFLQHNLPFFLFFLLLLWTSGYYLLNSYDDKIRTRMMLYIYIFQSVLIAAYAILTFRFFESTPLLLLNISPLLAHYFTLRNTWLSFVVFVFTILGFVVLALSPFYSYLCTRI